MKPLQVLEKYFYNSFTITVALILLVFMPTELLAAETKPQDPPPKTTGTSGGSRAYEPVIFIDSDIQQLIDKLLIANLEIAQT